MPSDRARLLRTLGFETWVPRDEPAPAWSGSATEEIAEIAPIYAASPVAQPTIFARPESPPPSAVEARTSRMNVPADWQGLREAVIACRGCRLCETRTQTVFGVGAQRAPLMVVGEGPGADEDAQGAPFVGRAGKLLDEMLRAIGRSRTEDGPEKSVFIANVVKCRPPANREPAEDEAEACRGFLEAQLRLVKPKLIVALGRVAAQRLLVTDAALSRLRGQMHTWGPEGTPLMVTYHPAYLLRSPGEKAKSWEDLKRIHQFLQAPA